MEHGVVPSYPLRAPSVSPCLRVGPFLSPAFTLVELLVAVAVIAVLAGVMLPVLAGARAKAREAGCASNLRQLALANRMYAADHDGCFAPAAQEFFRRDERRWFGVRGADGRFEPRDGPLVPYLRDGGGLRRCGEFQSSVGFDQGTGGYGYNYLAVGGRVWRLGYVPEAFDQGMSEAELPKPAETAMFADCALDIGVGLAEYGFLAPPPALAARIAGAQVLDPSVHFRHHGRANVVFVDGHARALPRALSTTSSPGYPSADPEARGLGWFAPVAGDTFYDAD
jgi:prepilin-type N-terminal cleavage/methylation domain-containing protein/prepilin-type processing-associated H-X9-DG protein